MRLSCESMATNTPLTDHSVRCPEKGFTVSRVSSLANWFLRSPLLWGGLATLAFYAALRTGAVSSPLLNRYFGAHPVEWTSTLLFFVAMAALGVRLFGLVGQFHVLKLDLLGDAPEGGQPTSAAPHLLRRLDELPAIFAKTRLVERLRGGLEYVRDTDSADSLEEHLLRQEDNELENMSAGYALPRLVRATLPIVGMLGTVIGITLAIGQLSPDQLEQSLTSVMAALSIAFDTTAQAMSLMLVLWFAIFGAERMEERLLSNVNRATAQMLVGRFQQFGTATDPNVASIRRMSEQVVTAVEQLSAKQAETWQSAIDATHQQWADATRSAGETLTSSLKEGLKENLRDHAKGLTEGAEQQISQLNANLATQTSMVSKAIIQQMEKLADLEANHTERLTEGADNLLGNLRNGLERMAELLVEALQKHGETLTSAEEELASENRRHLGEVEAALGESMVVAADRQEKLIRQSEKLLKEMQEALVSAAGATVGHQEQLVKQGEVLLRVVESTDHVQQLEETLSRNLSSLGRAHNFEETLQSLSAAIQLLSARTGREQDAGTPSSKAA